MPKPAGFDGSRGKTCSFLQSLVLYFKGTPGISEDQKVSFTLSLMDSGAAARWRDRMIQLQDNFAQNPLNPNTVIPPSSFAGIKMLIEKDFGDPNPRATAQRQIEALKQAQKPAEEFVTEFQNLALDTGYDDEALINKFKHGLNRPLLVECYRRSPLPTTLKEWQDTAINADRNYREMTMWTQGGRTQGYTPRANTSTPSFSAAVPTPTPPRDPNAMDVDRTRTRRPFVCYNCNGEGHMARDCKQPKKPRRVRAIAEMSDGDFLEYIKVETAEREKANKGNSQEHFHQGDT